MTRQNLLSTAKLRYRSDVCVSKAYPDRILLRSSPDRPPLVVTPLEARLLTECFAQPVTVPAVLVALLRERRCPPMNAYYELVLQAHAAGVLVAEEAATAAPAAWQLPLALPPAGAARGGLVLFAAGIAALPFGHWRLPAGWAEWLGSFAVASAVLSAGSLLAALALRGAGRPVHLRRVSDRRIPVMYFKIDYAEAVMAGGRCETAVGLLRAAPAAVAAAAAAWWQPGLLLGALAALLWLLRPWGDSAALQWLRGRHGTPHLSVPTGTLLLCDEETPRRSPWLDFNRRGRLAWAALGTAWAVLFAAAAGHLLTGGLERAYATLADRWRTMGSLQLGAAAGALLLVLIAGAWAVPASRRRAARRRWRTPLRGQRSPITRDGPLTAETIVELLRQFVVLKDLSAEDRAALAAAVQPVAIGASAVVFEEDDAADAFYFVVDGELEIQKRLPGRFRRRKPIGLLGPGDSFGEIALLENAPRTASVRATRSTRLLRLARDDFDRLLTQRVSAAKLREVLQSTAFLGRLVHFAGWSFDDLARFAHRCKSVRFEPGAAVLREGQLNGFFYIVYDGVLEERKAGKVVRRLLPGDYFGEDSLIRTNAAAIDVVAVQYFGGHYTPEDLPARSDVTAVEESRCLAMPGADFLDFFSRDFRVSLRMAPNVGGQ